MLNQHNRYGKQVNPTLPHSVEVDSYQCSKFFLRYRKAFWDKGLFNISPICSEVLIRQISIKPLQTKSQK
jgi:hypothetical protein